MARNIPVLMLAASLLLFRHAQPPAYADAQIYWSDSDSATIWRANDDGSAASVILPLAAGAEPRGIALDAMGGFLYWTENGTNRIRRAGLDGAGPQDIITTGLGFPADIEIDLAAAKLYWADRDLDVIRRSNLDGSEAETIVSVPAPGNTGAPYFLELDPAGNKLYWSDFDSGVIHRANLDGSSAEAFVSGLDRVRDIEILDDKIYWTDRDARLIQRQNLDGTLRETLYGPSGLVLPHGLALDPASGFLYIADADGRQVYRGAIEGGSALEPIGPGSLLNPWDVALLVPEAVAGDFNGDGAVDAADYVVWRKGLGTAHFPEDYNLWREHFGEIAASGSLVYPAVPEPACAWLLIFVTACGWTRFRNSTRIPSSH
jgi:DNA-binding beta-propeller fold protein YncE